MGFRDKLKGAAKKIMSAPAYRAIDRKEMNDLIRNKKYEFVAHKYGQFVTDDNVNRDKDVLTSLEHAKKHGVIVSFKDVNYVFEPNSVGTKEYNKVLRGFQNQVSREKNDNEKPYTV